MEKRKNIIIIILVIVIALLSGTIGFMLGIKNDNEENNKVETNSNIEENTPTIEEQNIDVEIAFSNFITTKGLSVKDNVYDKESLNSSNCTSAKAAFGDGYSLEIYKFDSEENAKKYYVEQQSYKLSVSDVKQLINSESVNNYDYYEAILTPNLEQSPNATGNEIDYVYRLRINNFYILLFETSTNNDKTNMISIAEELKESLGIK